MFARTKLNGDVGDCTVGLPFGDKFTFYHTLKEGLLSKDKETDNYIITLENFTGMKGTLALGSILSKIIEGICDKHPRTENINLDVTWEMQ